MAKKKSTTKRTAAVITRPVKLEVVSKNDAESPIVRRYPNQMRELTEVRIDYVKSNNFKVVYAEGFHGGPTPNGQRIHLAIFNERRPIAKSEQYSVNDDGSLGDMKWRIERDAVIREVEVSVLMDLEKAVVLHKWLSETFKKLGAMQEAAVARNSRKKKD